MIRQQPFTSPEEALAHYGVKGMRWGVRKAEESGGGSSTVGVDPVTAAIGAVWLATLLGTTYMSVRDARRAVRDSGAHIQKKTANVAWKKDPSLTKKMSVDDLYDKVVTGVNPKYGSPGTKMNCRRCTLTYEMRRRGNDVKATQSHYATGQDMGGLKKATGGGHYESSWGQKQIASPSFLAKATASQRSEAIFSSLSQHPEGARGELAMAWTFGGGHSMAWEIVKGKPVVFDTQTSKAYRSADAFNAFTPVVRDAAHTRLDNAKLEDQFLRRWVTNA